MIRDVIRQYSFTQPGRPAIVSIDKEPLSYAQLQQQIEEIGSQLRLGGFASEARIGVALLDGPEAIVAILAVACHATVVPVNNSLSPDELRQLFEQASLDAIVLAPTTAVSIRRVANDLGITIIEASTGTGAEIACTVRVPATAACAAGEPGPHSIALILQTSGTTGRPKLVPITHRNLLSEADKMRDWFKLTPNDRCLSSLPLCYAHGLREILFPPILTGGSIARPANHTQLDIAAWLGKLEPTWYSTFPIFHRAIFELITANGGKRPVHNLRFILSAGTPLKPELQKGLENILGVPVLEFYGIGEGGHMSANLPLPRKHKPGTCGIPLPGDMMIARDGCAVAAGELGEVLVRGPTVISGYLNDPQTNKDAFVDGWFRTGDLGSFDADGFLSIHGRYKELINRGGEKLSPIEVEQVLLRHPAVADAAACGIPHPRLGEDVAAAVVLHASKTVTASELQTFARGHLTPFKVPRVISIVPELPKDVTGKVQRRDLSASLASAAAAAFDASLDEPDCPLAADLIQIWRDLLQCKSVGLDDDFFAKGGDSLLAVQMRLEVEKLTGMVLPDALPFEAPTIRQLTRAITECNQDGVTSPLTEWSDGAGRPFFLFHGDFISAGLYLRRFADLLGRATRVISVAPHGLGREPIPSAVQQMARERLPLLLAAQPEGPFRLGGHCNGGSVAFEVARLLQASGHRVELLAMIDVPLLNAGAAMRLLRRALAGALRLVGNVAARERLMAGCFELVWLLYGKVRRFYLMTWTKRRAKMAGRLKFAPLRRLLGASDQSGSAQSLPQADPLQRREHYFATLASYFPKPLDVPIVYYSAEHSGRYAENLTSQLEIKKIPSDHYACVTTQAHFITDHLRKRLSGHPVEPLLESTTASAPPVTEPFLEVATVSAVGLKSERGPRDLAYP